MKKLIYIIILFVALSINVHVHALSDSEIEQKLSTLKSDTFLINYPVGSIKNGIKIWWNMGSVW